MLASRTSYGFENKDTVLYTILYSKVQKHSHLEDAIYADNRMPSDTELAYLIGHASLKVLNTKILRIIVKFIVR